MSVEDCSVDDAARLRLMSLPGASQLRINWLLGFGSATEAVARLASGEIDGHARKAPGSISAELILEWRSWLNQNSVDRLFDELADLDAHLLTPSSPLWPFRGEPYPPVAMIYRGQLELLDVAPLVAVVGTRRCTSVARRVAYQLGADLAGSGAGVVSGLAIGVDGASHQGALDHAGVAIAVVGSGIDCVYPQSNKVLWERVASTGLLLTEAPVGARPERWRFPARNRLLASLASAVVVVESHQRGGSLLTVDEALERAKPVFAVPGSVLSPAAEGSNALLIDGAHPCRNADDVLAFLGHERLFGDMTKLGSSTTSELGRKVLVEAAAGPVNIDVLVAQLSVSPKEMLAEVQRLRTEGLLLIDGSIVQLR